MSSKSTITNEQPIDAVIAWVDGNDLKLREKRNRYLGNTDPSSKSSGAHATRFASVNEIRYCVLSIFRFAPFIRNIYVITDGQDPELYEDIKAHFPDRIASFKVVDHKEVFEGHDQALPTFNSISIGHMSWRIKELADQFVYFNDDTFLIRDMKPEDFFREGLPVLRGKWIPAPRPRLVWNSLRRFIYRKLLGQPDYEPRASFHLGQWNSASLLDFRWRYFTVAHTPHTADKSVLEEYWQNNSRVMEKNISFHFRDPSQFTFIALSHHLQLKAGNRNIEKPALAYLQPYGRAEGYLDKKLAFCEQDAGIKFLCVQSLDQCPEPDQQQVLHWLEQRLGI